MSYSLDVNILLYASDTSSRLHTAASGFLQSCMEGGDLFYIAWPTVMGYLRIATHPSIFDEPLTSVRCTRMTGTSVGPTSWMCAIRSKTKGQLPVRFCVLPSH
ncbi:MAG: hypothetical protein F4X98_08540 [Gammaproteobacteria bacterium]|nr:hypothetical protein [Gammaproteobacteria bacterium]